MRAPTLVVVTTLIFTSGAGAEVPPTESPETLVPPEDVAPSPAAPVDGAAAAEDATDDPVVAAPTAPSPFEGDAVPPPLGITDVIGPILKTFLMLGVVLAIAYLSLHKGLGKLVERQTSGKRVKVVERIGLDQRRSLYLVDVDGQQMLLGGSDHGVVHLKDLAAKPPDGPAPKSGLVARFTDALDRGATDKDASTSTAALPRTDAVEGAKS